tara:strand:- start:38 stop:457 length:420 start_codon:yes stop_codon:yes gene_type:complete
MSVFYIGVGFAHFISPEKFLLIMPPYLPFHLELIYVSGFVEILLGVLLLIKRFRFFAGFGLIVLLIFVFPANIYLYTSDIARDAYGQISKLDALIRMFFQLPLIMIAYWHSQKNTSKRISYLYTFLSIITILYFGYILF